MVSMKVGFGNFVKIVSPLDFEFVIQTHERYLYFFPSQSFLLGKVGLERVSMNRGNLV